MICKSAKVQFVPHDVIAGILALVKSEYLTGNRRKFHQAIHELRESRQILKCFSFGQDSFSRTLDEILDFMELSQLMTGELPDFKRSILNTRAQKTIRQNLPQHFNGIQIKELQQIAQKLEEICRPPF